MVNYYKQFPEFIEQEKIKERTPVDEFKQHMMIFYGFSEGNKALNKWINNFVSVGFIKLTKKGDDKWLVILL